MYFEKIVKKDDTSLWVRNLQMYVWTTLASVLAVITKDLTEVQEKGFFFAYSPAVWFTLGLYISNSIFIGLSLMNVFYLLFSLINQWSLCGFAHLYGSVETRGCRVCRPHDLCPQF